MAQGYHPGRSLTGQYNAVWPTTGMDSFAQLQIPDRYNLVDHFMDRHIREGHGGVTAIIAGDRRMSYAEVAIETGS